MLLFFGSLKKLKFYIEKSKKIIYDMRKRKVLKYGK